MIHAWPSFALMGAYELLMREFRTDAGGERNATVDDEHAGLTEQAGPAAEAEPTHGGGPDSNVEHDEEQRRPQLRVVAAASSGREKADAEIPEPSEAVPRIQVDAWQWALNNRREDGSLPSGKEIAACFEHKERWGRLIKQWGYQGRFDHIATSLPSATTNASTG
ncbi:hypothetical protein HDA32_000577 [Spinactinospora alkalitolerans]|uniref:Uncharacterized protein n=1 Tax=Spinactinospora alkalitolerans TaxID=687207 RepID=A0A852TQ98_9ACTN|nr:hypothetical protein [Spinactinospora alkalitolerans]NYE45457.1 hypothetical protein [Spinactinospora alkalitolerans]